MKFFFVKDQVDQGKLEIRHLGTEDMWVDVLTKPKQGKAFRRDGAKLMNCIIDWQEPGTSCSKAAKAKKAKTIKKIVGVPLPKRGALNDISNVVPMPIRAVHA